MCLLCTTKYLTIFNYNVTIFTIGTKELLENYLGSVGNLNPTIFAVSATDRSPLPWNSL